MTSVIAFPVRTYRDLEVWQRSKALVKVIYLATQHFPKEEMYGLSSQMRRAAVSVPSNIAEGNARSTKEYIRFIDIALGSLAELETQCEIACDLDYITQEAAGNILTETDEITRMLGGLAAKLKARLP